MPRQEVGRLVALMPGVEHRLLPENRTQRKIRPTQLIFHSIVGSAEGAYRYFRDGTNLESTFIVAKSGKIIQLMDTERQADANFRANVRAGSIETEDNGDPDKDPWSSAQLRSLLRIARFYHEHHGVPRRQCPRWDAAGYGYHRLFPSQWTSVKGKGLRRSTPIPTPDGIRALGSLRVGDQVFDESGDPTRITEISDYTPRAVYRITFNDGLEVIADDAHQWVTYTLGERGAYFRRDRPRDQHRGPKPVGFPENWAAGRT